MNFLKRKPQFHYAFMVLSECSVRCSQEIASADQGRQNSHQLIQSCNNHNVIANIVAKSPHVIFIASHITTAAVEGLNSVSSICVSVSTLPAEPFDIRHGAMSHHGVYGCVKAFWARILRRIRRWRTRQLSSVFILSVAGQVTRESTL